MQADSSMHQDVHNQRTRWCAASAETDISRVHLVVDCKVNDWLKSVIASSTQIAYKKEEADPNLINTIKELRYQNTDASNKLAAELEKKIKDILTSNTAL